MRRTTLLTLAMLLLMMGYAAGRADLRFDGVTAQSDCQTFTETGKTVCAEFLAYWKANGGLAQQGYPISDTFNEKSETDGQTYKVQYFERAVFELHPEKQPPYNVLLTLLGSQKFKQRYNGTQPNDMGATNSATTVATRIASMGATPAAPMVAANRTTANGFAVTVNVVRDPAQSDSSYSTPKAGNRYVAFDITVENTGTKQLSYNKFECSIKTTDDRRYDVASGVRAGMPDLGSGTNQPGERTRGWVVFEIPQGAKIESFSYRIASDNIAIVRL